MSNKAAYALPVGESDLERMTLLGSIYQPFCNDFLLENGLKPGLCIADVGCGPGNTTLWLAEQTGNTGKVFAIDNNEAQLAIVEKKISENSISHVTTYRTDIYDIEKINQTFDIIFCRFLFIHLPQPQLAIEKLQNLLAPGGRLIIAELDNSTWTSRPEHEALRKDTQLLCAVGIKKGLDFCIGPKLYAYLHQADFSSINIKVAQPRLLKAQRKLLHLRCQAWANTYLQLQLISQTELADLLKNLDTLINNDEYLVLGAKMYLACAKGIQ